MYYVGVYHNLFTINKYYQLFTINKLCLEGKLVVNGLLLVNYELEKYAVNGEFLMTNKANIRLAYMLICS